MLEAWDFAPKIRRGLAYLFLYIAGWQAAALLSPHVIVRFNEFLRFLLTLAVFLSATIVTDFVLKRLLRYDANASRSIGQLVTAFFLAFLIRLFM